MSHKKMSNNDRRNWQVLLGVVAVLGAICTAWLVNAGLTDDNIRIPIRRTAQLAFSLYIVVLVARPLQQLLRKDWTASLLRNRRLVGVAFAAVMTVHLGLIALRFGTQPELGYPISKLLIGGSVYAVFYLMLITSFDAPRKALGPKAWKALHRTGLVLAAIVFAAPRSFEHATDPDYYNYAIPFALAILLRVTAWLQSRRRDS